MPLRSLRKFDALQLKYGNEQLHSLHQAHDVELLHFGALTSCRSARLAHSVQQSLHLPSDDSTLPTACSAWGGYDSTSGSVSDYEGGRRQNYVGG
jgi:hypothetical protein